jgi:hypothetical protein
VTRWRAAAVVVVVGGAVVIGGGCSDSTEGAEVLAELRSEPIWTALPAGGQQAAFSAPEHCRPHEETAVVLFVNVGDGGIEEATAHYAEVLSETGWDISKQELTGDATTVVAEKVADEGPLGIQVSGSSSFGRVEVRGWPTAAC